MIYIDNTTDTQLVLFPIDGGRISASLAIRSTVDRKTVYEQTVTPSDGGRGYWRVSLLLPSGIPDGEYDWSMTVEETVMGAGVMYIGPEDRTDHPKYEKTIEYKQYE